MKILVVDDEPKIQPLIEQLFAKQIRREGYEFLFAANGREALNQVMQHPDIEIILSDIKMPLMDGLALLMEIQRLKQNFNPMLTIVMVSAYDDMENIRRAMNGGAFDFITKPINPVDLRATIAKTVDHVQLLREAIEKKKKAEKSLQQLNAELEKRVEARTAELVAANEALQTINAELDAFAHTVAHDLKAPLANVIGYTEVLERDAPDMSAETLIQFGQGAHRAAVKASKIIDELLLLAGVRKQTVELAPIPMGSIIEQVKERLAPMITKTEAKLILPESWPVAIGYAPWVEEVWANYLSNGLKYGMHQNSLKLELGATHQQDGFIEFWIQDYGFGIAPKDQQNLFTEFTRVTQFRFQGQGLGLSIVRRIVERLGGQVGVESEGIPGQGCKFYFTLPSIEGYE